MSRRSSVNSHSGRSNGHTSATSNGGPVNGAMGNGDDSSESDQSWYQELKDMVINRDRSRWQINILYDIGNGIPEDIDRLARQRPDPSISDLRAQLDVLNREIEDLDGEEVGEESPQVDEDLMSLQELDSVAKSLNQLKDSILTMKYEKDGLCTKLVQLGILDSSSVSTSSSSLTTTSTLSSPAPDIHSDTSNILTIDDNVLRGFSDLSRMRHHVDRITEGVKNLSPNSGDE